MKILEKLFCTRLSLCFIAVNIIVFAQTSPKVEDERESANSSWKYNLYKTADWKHTETNKPIFPYNYVPRSSVKWLLLRFKHILTLFQYKNCRKSRHILDHIYIFLFLLRNSGSDEKYWYRWKYWKIILHKIVSMLYCRKYYIFCVNNAESGGRMWINQFLVKI